VKFKLDENLPLEILEDLRRAGQEADSVHDEGLAGEPDSVVLEKSREDGRILLTLDKGIGDLRSYRSGKSPGIVLFRPGSSGRSTVLSFVRVHLPEILNLDLAGHLTVVTDLSIRRRWLPA
jgi:predicted nuclease of predicted toxin-antitoxin system